MTTLVHCARFAPVLSESEVARFWRSVDKETGPEHPTLGRCWTWKLKLTDGYGRFGTSKTPARGAYRFAYFLEHGPIDQGLDIDHLCRNRACVRASHLEAVTHRENLARGIGSKGAPNKPEREPVAAPDGTEAVIAQVAAEAGVSVATIRGFETRIGQVRDARREVARRLRLAGLSLHAIGQALGGRHHSTIVCALRKVDLAAVSR